MALGGRSEEDEAGYLLPDNQPRMLLTSMAFLCYFRGVSWAGKWATTPSGPGRRTTRYWRVRTDTALGESNDVRPIQLTLFLPGSTGRCVLRDGLLFDQPRLLLADRGKLIGVGSKAREARRQAPVTVGCFFFVSVVAGDDVGVGG